MYNYVTSAQNSDEPCFKRRLTVIEMNMFTSKYRMYYFLSAYVGVFAVLAILGYYMIERSGLVRVHNAPVQTFSTDLTYYDLPRMTVACRRGFPAAYGR
jgi:hypothetical protein